jgi:exodeoxyribonuclease V alpha subunit
VHTWRDHLFRLKRNRLAHNYAAAINHSGFGADGLALHVEVSFDDETRIFTRDDLINLDLAYALTCHKLQGKQAARVVVAIEPTRLLEPSWLYTTITRAEKQAILVGPRAVLEQALRREFAWRERNIGIGPAGSARRYEVVQHAT